jgi:hypothetical protein
MKRRPRGKRPPTAKEMATPVGDHLRNLSLGYKGEHAEGMRQAADIVDAQLHANPTMAIGKSNPLDFEDEYLDRALAGIAKATERLEELAADLASAAATIREPLWSPKEEEAVEKPREPPALLLDVKEVKYAPVNGEEKLGKCANAVLNVLVQARVPLSRTRLAVLAGYAPSAGGFGNTLGQLRRLHLVAGHPSGNLFITHEGARRKPPTTPVHYGRELVERWCARVGKCERGILQALAHAYPGHIGREELANRAGGYDPDAGGFGNALGHLKGLCLVEAVSQRARAKMFRATFELMGEEGREFPVAASRSA